MSDTCSHDDYLSHLEHALERELANGCTEHDFRADLKLDARSAFESHRASVALIRELRENPDLRVWYHESRRDDRLGATTNLIDVYVDEYDNSYWIKPYPLAIVQSVPAADRYTAPRPSRARKERVNVAPIREKALSLLKRLVPEFEHRWTGMHPFEGNDNGAVYHFRWDDYSVPSAESDEAPFVHISMRPDGRLHSFTNALGN